MRDYLGLSTIDRPLRAGRCRLSLAGRRLRLLSLLHARRPDGRGAEWAAIRRTLPNVQDDIAAGRFDAVNDWRRDNIWTQASLYSTPELIERATGEKLNAAHFIALWRSVQHRRQGRCHHRRRRACRPGHRCGVGNPASASSSCATGEHARRPGLLVARWPVFRRQPLAAAACASAIAARSFAGLDKARLPSTGPRISGHEGPRRLSSISPPARRPWLRDGYALVPGGRLGRARWRAGAQPRQFGAAPHHRAFVQGTRAVRAARAQNHVARD